MSEKVTDPIQRLELKELQPGQVVKITTGIGDAAWRYVFEIKEASNWPKGALSVLNEDGEAIHTMPFCLHGSGRWTDRTQNPVQTQERAFTSYFDSLSVGNFMVGAVPDATPGDRLVFDKRGQEISAIEVE